MSSKIDREYLTSDEFLGIAVPIIVYWAYSGFYGLFGNWTKYRLHSKKDEDTKNLVSKREVVTVILLAQLVQACISYLVFQATREANEAMKHIKHSMFDIVRQFVVGMFVFDAWQFFVHRYMHINKFLYRHVHSWHHRLLVPYAFGAQYLHPLEGFIINTLGGVVTFVVSGMTPRTSLFFFSLTIIKGIDDHCGLCLPGNPFHIFFRNNTAYHDIHHQLVGNKYNFGEPFFVFWDKIFGSHMPYTIEKRADGGLEARPAILKAAKQVD